MGNTAGMLLTGLMVVSGAVSALAAVEDKGAGSGISATAPRERSGQSYLQRLDVDNDGAVTLRSTCAGERCPSPGLIEIGMGLSSRSS
jgi:crotonobetainyl-CoA:carnitine CoA-transferase CaiB-like acyl-CoA transferase